MSDAQNCGKIPFLSRRRTTLSSLRVSDEQNCAKTKFFSCPSDPFVTWCVSDDQNCGKMQILRLNLATLSSLRAYRTRKKLWQNAKFSRRRSPLSSLRACRTLKTVVKCKVSMCPGNPFVTSCVSDAQNCGKMQSFHGL